MATNSVFPWAVVTLGVLTMFISLSTCQEGHSLSLHDYTTSDCSSLKSLRRNLKKYINDTANSVIPSINWSSIPSINRTDGGDRKDMIVKVCHAVAADSLGNFNNASALLTKACTWPNGTTTQTDTQCKENLYIYCFIRGMIRLVNNGLDTYLCL